MYTCVSIVCVKYAEQVAYYHYVHVSHYELFPTVSFKMARIIKFIHAPFLHVLMNRNFTVKFI